MALKFLFAVLIFQPEDLLTSYFVLHTVLKGCLFSLTLLTQSGNPPQRPQLLKNIRLSDKCRPDSTLTSSTMHWSVGCIHSLLYKSCNNPKQKLCMSSLKKCFSLNSVREMLIKLNVAWSRVRTESWKFGKCLKCFNKYAWTQIYSFFKFNFKYNLVLIDIITHAKIF